MRITCLYDLEKDYHNTKKRLSEGLLTDIQSLAQKQFGHNTQEKFVIRIRIEPIPLYH